MPSRLGSQRASPHGFAGDGADGEKLWNVVVRKHPSVMIVICGHVRTGGLGYCASEGDYGNTVHEMMANYQKLRGGGMAFMRLLEFLPDGKTVQVRTFSPATGDVRHSELEEFSFELRGATRDQPVPVGPGAPRPLRKPPIHRYRFDGSGAHGATLTDHAGNLAGAVHAPDGSARLNGKGQLTLANSEDSAGHGRIPAGILRGRRRVSMELWVTPTETSYNWDPVARFADGKDAFYYTFRTLQKHRAELIDDGHNEDIQRTINVTIGEPLHIVMTYDQDGPGGHPEIASFIDGEETGRMRTSIKLADLVLTEGRIGPFAGVFDELRFYDYALSPGEAANNFAAGPDEIRVSAD